MHQQLLKILEEVSGGKCYSSYKYSYDKHDLPLDEFDDGIKISVGKSGEKEKHKKTINLRRRAQEYLVEKPIFKYFLDGSRRVYKIDDIAINDKMYPILAGQVGVGCCERMSSEKFKCKNSQNFIVLCVPESLDKDGKQELFYNNLAGKLTNVAFLRNKGIRIHKIIPYSVSKLTEGENYINRGIARIQDEMIEQEKQMVKSMAEMNLLSNENYLLKDGSLEYAEKGLRGRPDLRLNLLKNNFRHVVGVSKSFNPEKFKDDKKGNNAVRIADLPLFHRTPAYMYETEYIQNVRFAIWYIRIRDSLFTLGQFDGIVKVEKILIQPEEIEFGLSSEEVDLISCNILNERNPVAYGVDKRWANHLYPIYLTETFIKSRYLSDNYLLNIF